MKKLILIRHAKSSWNFPHLKDFDRPLNSRGKKDAPLMGRRLKKKKEHPDLIISSPAKRAIKTAKIIAKQLDYPKKKIVVKENIYEASTDDLLEVIRNIDDKFTNVYLFGHNPGFNNLSYYLTKKDVDNIPTCGIFAIEFEIESWAYVKKGGGIFVYFDFPKQRE
jgi:phosphohistidine phosphatase